MVLSRLQFCDECAKHNRPSRDDYIILYGSCSKKYYMRKVNHVAIDKRRIGLVPHLLVLKVSSAKNVVYTSVCGVVGCGVSITKNNMVFYLRPEKKHVVSVKKWNAIVNFKDTGYEL